MTSWKDLSISLGTETCRDGRNFHGEPHPKEMLMNSKHGGDIKGYTTKNTIQVCFENGCVYKKMSDSHI